MTVSTQSCLPPLILLEVNNIYAWAYRRVALRAKQISDIFRGVWGECAINDRVRVVVAHQMATPYTFETGLDMIDIVYGPPDRWFYGIAGKKKGRYRLSIRCSLFFNERYQQYG